jgi:hypothetical protein
MGYKLDYISAKTSRFKNFDLQLANDDYNFIM